MEFQNLFAYLIIGIAAVFVVRSFVRQFTAKDGAGCTKCPQCGPETETETEQFIEIDQSGFTKSG